MPDPDKATPNRSRYHELEAAQRAAIVRIIAAAVGGADTLRVGEDVLTALERAGCQVTGLWEEDSRG